MWARTFKLQKKNDSQNNWKKLKEKWKMKEAREKGRKNGPHTKKKDFGKEGILIDEKKWKMSECRR